MQLSVGQLDTLLSWVHATLSVGQLDTTQLGTCDSLCGAARHWVVYLQVTNHKHIGFITTTSPQHVHADMPYTVSRYPMN